MYLPAIWPYLTEAPYLTATTVVSIGESAARGREAREGTVQHTLIDSLYVRSWT
ncbi:hypothetical protein [Deinococcus sp.]|uniref:hypothetical protein n=1 Tax=Deinococcus sp. TaxID=47478 RepID=UPI003C7CAE60